MTSQRNIIKEIHYLLSQFPIVAILGARQVGKSTLLKQILPKASFFDLENEADLKRIEIDATLFLQEVQTPIIIDEAQFLPKLFSALRVAVDKNRNTPGQFLLSGSSSPELLNNISETLAGRVAVVELNGFSWQEAFKNPVLNLPEVLKDASKLTTLKPNFSKKQLLDLCFYGSYPEPFLKHKDNKFFSLWMQNYIKTYVDRDVRRLFPTLNIDNYKRFVQMLAFSSGDMINAARFANALGTSQPTITKYLAIIEQTFLWRKLPAYENNHLKSLIKTPKGHLRDTGLINHFLHLKTPDDMKSHPQFGQIWESFIIEQIIRHFDNQLQDADFSYYRTKNGAEIDLIIAFNNQIIPIEIKVASTYKKSHIQNLNKFINQHNCPFGLLINNGDTVFKISKNVYQIPAVCL
jgi:predicted AAA+ superfamily ATPase